MSEGDITTNNTTIQTYVSIHTGNDARHLITTSALFGTDVFCDCKTFDLLTISDVAIVKIVGGQKIYFSAVKSG